jgi:hypothetical protein
MNEDCKRFPLEEGVLEMLCYVWDNKQMKISENRAW